MKITKRPLMIVEDDPYIMSTLTEVFSMMERDLIVAHDGRQGIEKLKKLRAHEYPSCIILDLMMPEMTGEEFLFHIQALGSVNLDSIPIVVSSAAAHRMFDLKDPRVTFKLKKPVDMKDLEDIEATYR